MVGPTCFSGPTFVKKFGGEFEEWHNINRCGGTVRVYWSAKYPSGKTEKGEWLVLACSTSNPQGFEGEYTFLVDPAPRAEDRSPSAAQMSSRF
jgi:hypothetical protein